MIERHLCIDVVIKHSMIVLLIVERISLSRLAGRLNQFYSDISKSD
jgi:hypothetical protein